MSNSAKLAALKKARMHINRKLGVGVLQSFGQAFEKKQAVPTMLPSLDKLLNIGGIPRGRIIELFGAEQVGKSTMCGMIAAQVQRLGGYVLWEDFEQGMDPSYLQHLGVDISPDMFEFCQPSTFEQGAHITKTFLEVGKQINLGLVVIDSIAGMNPSFKRTKGNAIADNDVTMEDASSIIANRPGQHSLMLSNFTNNLKGLVKECGCIVIGVNQVRSQISSMGSAPKTTPGGHAFKHYASVRMELKKVKSNQSTSLGRFAKKADSLVKVSYPSADISINLVKSRVCTPFTSITAVHNYGEGFDTVLNLWEECLNMGLVSKDKGGFVLNLLNKPKFKDLDDFRELCQDKEKHFEIYKAVMGDKLYQYDETFVPDSDAVPEDEPVEELDETPEQTSEDTVE